MMRLDVGVIGRAMSERRFQSLGQVEAFLDELESARAVEHAGAWPAPRALAHCAQSIECSLSGYPVMRAWIFRATVGRIARATFLRRGSLSHDLAAHLPGAPEIEPELTLPEACTRLRRAIAAFRGHSASLAPHLAFGSMDKARYERVHAMHVADHASDFTVVTA